MRVFVTGGTGYIGAHVVLELLRCGHEVSVLARNPNKVPELSELAGVHIIEGSLLDSYLIEDAVRGHDAVIHTAIIWDDDDPDTGTRDLQNTNALFIFASNARVKHFIYTSSTAVHRPFKRHMTEEDDVHPVEPYGGCKRLTELTLLAMNAYPDIKLTIIRAGPTIGAPAFASMQENGDRRFRSFLASARKDAPIEVTRNDGRQFIAAKDLSRVYSSALNDGQSNQIYLAVAQDFITWEEIASLTIKESSSKSLIVINDQGLQGNPFILDTAKIYDAFDLRFTARPTVKEHIKHLASQPF